MIVIIGNGISGVTAARHIRKKSNSGYYNYFIRIKIFFFKDCFNVRFHGTYEIRTHTTIRSPFLGKE